MEARKINTNISKYQNAIKNLCPKKSINPITILHTLLHQYIGKPFKNPQATINSENSLVNFFKNTVIEIKGKFTGKAHISFCKDLLKENDLSKITLLLNKYYAENTKTINPQGDFIAMLSVFFSIFPNENLGQLYRNLEKLETSGIQLYLAREILLNKENTPENRAEACKKACGYAILFSDLPIFNQLVKDIFNLLDKHPNYCILLTTLATQLTKLIEIKPNLLNEQRFKQINRMYQDVNEKLRNINSQNESTRLFLFQISFALQRSIILALNLKPKKIKVGDISNQLSNLVFSTTDKHCKKFLGQIGYLLTNLLNLAVVYLKKDLADGAFKELYFSPWLSDYVELNLSNDFWTVYEKLTNLQQKERATNTYPSLYHAFSIKQPTSDWLYIRVNESVLNYLKKTTSQQRNGVLQPLIDKINYLDLQKVRCMYKEDVSQFKEFLFTLNFNASHEELESILKMVVNFDNPAVSLLSVLLLRAALKRQPQIANIEIFTHIFEVLNKGVYEGLHTPDEINFSIKDRLFTELAETLTQMLIANKQCVSDVMAKKALITINEISFGSDLNFTNLIKLSTAYRIISAKTELLDKNIFLKLLDHLTQLEKNQSTWSRSYHEYDYFEYFIPTISSVCEAAPKLLNEQTITNEINKLGSRAKFILQAEICSQHFKNKNSQLAGAIVNQLFDAASIDDDANNPQKNTLFNLIEKLIKQEPVLLTAEKADALFSFTNQRWNHQNNKYSHHKKTVYRVVEALFSLCPKSITADIMKKASYCFSFNFQKEKERLFKKLSSLRPDLISEEILEESKRYNLFDRTRLLMCKSLLTTSPSEKELTYLIEHRDTPTNSILLQFIERASIQIQQEVLHELLYKGASASSYLEIVPAVYKQLQRSETRKNINNLFFKQTKVNNYAKEIQTIVLDHWDKNNNYPK